MIVARHRHEFLSREPNANVRGGGGMQAGKPKGWSRRRGSRCAAPTSAPRDSQLHPARAFIYIPARPCLAASIPFFPILHLHFSFLIRNRVLCASQLLALFISVSCFFLPCSFLFLLLLLHALTPVPPNHTQHPRSISPATPIHQSPRRPTTPSLHLYFC